MHEASKPINFFPPSPYWKFSNTSVTSVDIIVFEVFHRLRIKRSENINYTGAHLCVQDCRSRFLENTKVAFVRYFFILSSLFQLFIGILF